MGQLILIGQVKIMPCQRCIGGKVMLFKDGRNTCVNCGADHTEEGELKIPTPANEFTLERTPARFSAKIYGVKL